MRTFAQRHPTAAFLTSPTWQPRSFAVPLLSTAGIGVIDLELPGVAPFVLLLSVALAAIAFLTGPRRWARWRPRPAQARPPVPGPPGWYAATLLLPAVAIATAAVFAGIDPIVELVSSPGMVLGTVVAGALVAFLLLLGGGGLDGIRPRRLQPRMGPIAASVVTTWLQAIVHLPLVFVAGGVTDARVPADQIPFYLVALITISSGW